MGFLRSLVASAYLWLVVLFCVFQGAAGVASNMMAADFSAGHAASASVEMGVMIVFVTGSVGVLTFGMGYQRGCVETARRIDDEAARALAALQLSAQMQARSEQPQTLSLFHVTLMLDDGETLTSVIEAGSTGDAAAIFGARTRKQRGLAPDAQLGVVEVQVRLLSKEDPPDQGEEKSPRA